MTKRLPEHKKKPRGTGSRFKKGEEHPLTHLTNEMVKAIRREYRRNGHKCSQCGRFPHISIKELAIRYGVNPRTMGNIIHKRTWSHVSLTRPDAE